MIELSLRQRQLLKWLGYPALALTTFALTAFYTFPYERLKTKVEQAASAKFEMTIGSAGPTLIPGGVVFEDVVIKTRPKDPDEKPAVIHIDELSADPSMLSLLTGTLAVDFDAEIGGGVVEGSIATGDSFELSVATESLPLGQLPWIAAAVGIPIDGKLDANIELDVPGMKWSEADGKVMLSCPSCTIGDGETEIELTPQRGRYRGKDIYDSGIPVPRLSLGNLKVELLVEDGVAKTERFGGESEDGRLYIDAEIRLSDQLERSRLSGCLEYKLTESLKDKGKVAEEFFTAAMVMQSRTRKPDGSHAITLGGTLSRFRPGRRACSAGPDDGGGAEPVRERPTISNVRPQLSPPDEPVDTSNEIRVTPSRAENEEAEQEDTRAAESEARADDEEMEEAERERELEEEDEDDEEEEEEEEEEEGDPELEEEQPVDEDVEGEADVEGYAEEATGEPLPEDEGAGDDGERPPKIRAIPSPE